MKKDGRVTLFLFIFITAIYALLSFFYTKQWFITGDEPEYLLITCSIVHDGDLNLRNNCENKDYREFWTKEPFELSTVADQKADRWYSTHFPGLPFMLAPFYLVGLKLGHVWKACQILIILLMSLTACNIYRILRLYDISPRSSLFALIPALLALPLAGYSLQLYPEVPLIWLLTLLMRVYLESEINEARALFMAFCLGIMPLLHIKFLLVSITCFFFIIIQKDIFTGRRARYLLISLCVLSLAAIYVLASWYKATNPPIGELLSLRYILPGVLGFFLDQQYGLFIYAPLYALSIGGIILFLQNRARLPAKKIYLLYAMVSFVILILLISSAVVVGATPRAAWTGGYSISGRLAIPFLPLFILGLAIMLERHRRFIYAYAPAALWSAAIGVYLLSTCPHVLFDSYWDGSVYLSALSSTAIDYRLLLPNLFRPANLPLNVIMAIFALLLIVAVNFAMLRAGLGRKIWLAIALVAATGYGGFTYSHYSTAMGHERLRILGPAIFFDENGQSRGGPIQSDFSKPFCMMATSDKMRLLKGRYSADFIVSLEGEKLDSSDGELILGIDADDGRIEYGLGRIEKSVIEESLNRGMTGYTIKFEHIYPLKYVRFRLSTSGRPFNGTVKLLGVRVRSL